MNFTVDETFKKGKKTAFCMSVDDVCPMSSNIAYDCGGDLMNGRLGNLKWLADRHPQLKMTLFVTADWREIQSAPTRRILSKIPILRDNLYLADRLPKGTLRIDRHHEFLSALKSVPAFEIATHGLSHSHKGLRIPVEFQNESKGEILEILDEMLDIFRKSKLDYQRGFCPPAWDAPNSLLQALSERGFKYVSSSRDLNTPISRDALTAMSGIKGIPLIFPSILEKFNIVHFPVNFQATSRLERCLEIIEAGGLVSVKAHSSHGMLDSADKLYMNYLDMLMSKLEDKYGDDIHWTSMGEMSDTINGSL